MRVKPTKKLLAILLGLFLVLQLISVLSVINFPIVPFPKYLIIFSIKCVQVLGTSSHADSRWSASFPAIESQSSFVIATEPVPSGYQFLFGGFSDNKDHVLKNILPHIHGSKYKKTA
ncbi:MAG: hypothetical protein DIU66_002685 [Bacillota bacterium]